MKFDQRSGVWLVECTECHAVHGIPEQLVEFYGSIERVLLKRGWRSPYREAKSLCPDCAAVADAVERLDSTPFERASYASAHAALVEVAKTFDRLKDFEAPATALAEFTEELERFGKP